MIRRALLALALAAATVVALPAAPAQARYCQMNHWCTTLYYTDGSLTTAVGGVYVECDGYQFQWGEWTPFVTFEEHPCSPQW
ncbi:MULTISPECIES: DUF6289 family protein [Polymorphospora]|uniref:DUF6289 family protein n=1 Tax=Polymorphospora lycopeni TaxID=3140240 RepID=A0ABV5CXF1_9ACTN